MSNDQLLACVLAFDNTLIIIDCCRNQGHLMYPSEELSLSFYGDVVAAAAAVVAVLFYVVVATAPAPLIVVVFHVKQLLLQH